MPKTKAWFFDAVGWADLLTWDDREDCTVSGMFVAALSHHGVPLNLNDTRKRNPVNLAFLRRTAPAAARDAHRSRLVREWFPAARSSDTPPLLATAFQHLFIGLCMLADWIGSDEIFFPFRVERGGEYIQTARANADGSYRKRIESRRSASGAPFVHILSPSLASCSIFQLLGETPSSGQ